MEKILETVASRSSQQEVDYYVFCICHGKREAAYNALIESNSAPEEASAFIDAVAALHNDDYQKVKSVQQLTNLTDDEMIYLAQATLRIFNVSR